MFNWVKMVSRQSGLTNKQIQKRRFHLGLDWGTSSTKMVLRDLHQRSESNAAYILAPEGCEGGYRYPSLVSVNCNCIYFGAKTLDLDPVNTKNLPSLKSRVVTKEFLHPHSEWRGLCEQDLAVLFLAHAISLGMIAATELADRVGCQPLISLTLGVPVAELEQQKIWRIYYGMIRLARVLAIDLKINPQGEKLDDAMTALKMAQQIDQERQSHDNLPENLHLQYLRPEVAAAMHWSIRSPTIENGLYSCVDIGAWTTNASFYRLANRKLDSGKWVQKGQFSFYGGKCQAPGMDRVCHLLSEAVGEKDFTKIRGQESILLGGKVSERVVDLAVATFFKTWKKAFQASYLKEKRQIPWEELKVMVIGGGSKVPLVMKKFQQFPGPDWKCPQMVSSLGVPKDLFEYPQKGVRADKLFGGDSTFALVAYGLSVPFGEFPIVLLQDMVPDWKPDCPTVRDIDTDDYYAD